LKGDAVPLMGEIKWDANGLVPMVLQDEKTRDVLMVAWVNADALRATIETGEAHFWSRSRKKFWKKGESSGHVQIIKELWFDCDVDTIVAIVEPKGPACHEGYRTCFFRKLDPLSVDGTLAVEGEREFDPCDVYGDQAKG
jgi:phosphoribosyl-AMP cyclohydrolase